MSQLNLGDKVRLLYDNLKDIKYSLATCVDMSNKSLEQYSSIIADNLGKLNAHGKVISGVKLYRDIEPALVELKLPVHCASMWGTQSLPISIQRDEISPTDFVSGTKVYGVSTSIDLASKAIPTGMWKAHMLNLDIKLTDVDQTETYYAAKIHVEGEPTVINLLDFDIIVVDVINQQAEI